MLEAWQGSGTPPGERSPRGPRLTAWYPADDITVQVSMATASHGRLGSRSYVTAQAAGRWPHMAPAPRPTGARSMERPDPRPQPTPTPRDCPARLHTTGASSTLGCPSSNPWHHNSTHSSQSLHPQLCPALLRPGPLPVLTPPRLPGLARGQEPLARWVMLLRGAALGEAPGW